MRTISSTASIALSGMNAAQQRLNTAAHNVANSSTEPFRREEVLQQEQPGGGVATSRQQASVPGHALEADVVNRLEAKSTFMANLALFKTHNSMAGALLDDAA